MKKVLIAILQLPKNAGSSRTVFEQVDYFLKHDYEVHVASLVFDDCFDENVKCHKLLPWIKSTGLRRRQWFNFQFNLLKKILRPEVVIGHGDIMEQDILTLHNSVFLAHEMIHGQFLDPKHEMAITHGNLLLSKKFKFLIANSELMKADLVKRFRIEAGKIIVAYPNVDTNVFIKQDEKERLKLRELFGFDEKVVVALVTSGNFRKRGVDRFVEAVEKLPISIREMADFRIVGKDKILASQIPNIVLDGKIDKIHNYYNAIDVFVLPGYIEEFGRVVTEAMACGLPIITCSSVGASEIIKGGARKGVLSPYSVEAFTALLMELIVSKPLREKLGDLNEEIIKLGYENLDIKLDYIIKNLDKNMSSGADERDSM